MLHWLSKQDYERVTFSRQRTYNFGNSTHSFFTNFNLENIHLHWDDLLVYTFGWEASFAKEL
jgi:hypothetical protein